MLTTKRLLLIISSLFLSLSLGLSQEVRGSDDGGQGGGDNPDPIIIHFPPCGNIANQMIEFRWTPKEGAVTYTVILSETLVDNSKRAIDSQKTLNTAVLLDLPTLDLTMGNKYTISVTSNNGKRSNDAEFTVRSKKDKHNVKLDLSKDNRFSLMNGVNKALRKAELLREKNWNLAAMKSLNIEVDNLNDIIRVNDHFTSFVDGLFPEGADGCAMNN